MATKVVDFPAPVQGAVRSARVVRPAVPVPLEKTEANESVRLIYQMRKSLANNASKQNLRDYLRKERDPNNLPPAS